MSKNATTAKLVEAIDNHLTETDGQIKRLEKVFELIGEKAVAKKCEANEIEYAFEIVSPDNQSDICARVFYGFLNHNVIKVSLQFQLHHSDF